jgi:excinuclease ABC subunit C
MARAQLDEQRKHAPDSPGVYLFRDADGTPLYIGKAKSLRKRLAQHLTNPSTSGGETLLTLSQEIDYIVTDNEWEALLLEQSLISREQPRFNIRLRRGHHYPYIAVSLDERYPRVYLTREQRQVGRRYFGPYETHYARELLKVLGRVFLYRTCEGPTPGRTSGSPCLDYFIKRCSAPCVEYISEEAYRAQIEQLMHFLAGDWHQTVDRLEQEMRQAAARSAFETAAILRDRWQALQRLVADNQSGLSRDAACDVVGVALHGREAHVQLLVVRDGNLQERQSYILENEAGAGAGEITRDFLLRFYTERGDIPSLIIVTDSTPDQNDIASFLSEERRAVVEVRVPQRGDKQRLLRLAERNAGASLQRAQLKHPQAPEAGEIGHDALVDLAGYLGLDHAPARIECYDVSNLGPTHTVSAMVVFENGQPQRSDYRRFRIRTTSENDFEAMRETLTRRLGRYRLNSDLHADDPQRDNSFATRPDLIVIDGGRGQLSAAVAAAEAFITDGVKVIALAKREEEIFVPDQPQPIIIARDQPASLLLQQIRNETHRFALTYHRQRRSSSAFQSSLDAIPGLGPKRKQALIRHFGSPGAVKTASLDELEQVIPARLAATVHRAFQVPAPTTDP